MTTSYQDFEDFYNSLTSRSQTELNKASLAGISALAIELKINKTFEASKLYFSESLIAEFRSLPPNLKNAFCEWAFANTRKFNKTKR